jgi:hypothetical protein
LVKEGPESWVAVGVDAGVDVMALSVWVGLGMALGVVTTDVAGAQALNK